MPDWVVDLEKTYRDTILVTNVDKMEQAREKAIKSSIADSTVIISVRKVEDAI